MAKTIIKNYVFKPGIGYLDNKLPNAWNLFLLNKDFILSEILSYINQEIADVEKCQRDINYIIEGAANDAALNTNYNARFLGYTEVNSLDLSNTVIRTINRARNAILNLNVTSSSNLAVNNINAFFDQLIEIINDGRDAAQPIFITPGVTTPVNSTAAKDQLLNNIDFIVAEINAYVAFTYPNADHNVDKCSRDIKYATEALAYDILYGGNAATYDQSKFFFYNTNENFPGIDPTHRIQTVSAYQHFQTIIQDIVQGIGVTPSDGNLAEQNVSGNVATASEASVLNALVEITINVVSAETSAEANQVLSNISRTPPVVTLWAVAELQDVYLEIIDNQEDIVTAITWPSNYTYNAEKCTRDANYVLDAYLYDLRYGGNEQTLETVKYYWDEDVAQVDGTRLPEIDTHAFIGELLNDFILLNIEFPRLGTVPQSIDLSYTSENDAFTRITTLTNTTVAIIENGLASAPTKEYNDVGTVKFTGMYNLEEILLITNVSKNEIIYNFGTSVAGGTLRKSKNYDSDFPAFNQTTDFVLTLTLNYNTESHTADDDLQLFVEQVENGKSILTTRPYNFGTDAIERNRVANPLSMLDADFEYGLQPTKWAAIGTLRGYPSIYEIPGTDTPVQNITTDASAGTFGIGQSLITVTTVGPHQLYPGDPFTIKALEDSVAGAARAEGSFTVVTTPSSSSFTYYAKAKVGTVNGQVIATSYTQLRKAGFYSGSSIGNATFDILSQGADATITLELDLLAGNNLIPFDGIAPDIGSPTDPVTVTDFPTGTQVTSVQATSAGGGTYISAQADGDWPAGSDFIEVIDATGIIEDLAIDRGDGTATFVESIVGNRLFLTNPLTSTLIGYTTLYENISAQNEISSGADALFDITATGANYSVTIVATGQDYGAGNRLFVPGNQLGGLINVHDLLINVETVVGNGSIDTISISGTAFDGNATIENVVGIVENNSGSGAIFDVSYADNIYSVSVSSPDVSFGYELNDKILISGSTFNNGDNTNDLILTVSQTGLNGSVVNVSIAGTAPDAIVTYLNPSYTTTGVGILNSYDITRTGVTYSLNFTNTQDFGPADTITILGTELDGAAPANDCEITVNTVDVNGAIETFSIVGTAVNIDSAADLAGTNFDGLNATFNIELSAGSYVNATVNQPGNNFAVGQEIIVSGSDLLGTSPTNDLTLQVVSVNTDYSLATVSVSQGIAAGGIGSFTNVSPTIDNPSGSNAIFSVLRSGPTYSVNVINGGIGYRIGDRLIITGNLLGGSSPANDLIIRILEDYDGQILDDSTNRFELIYESTTTSFLINFISTVRVTELSTGDLTQGTEIDFTALASLEINFQNAHGLVPGDTFIVTINSDDGVNNHLLASGAFFVSDVPETNLLRYQARSVGFIDTDIQTIETPTTQYNAGEWEWLESNGFIDDTPVTYITIFWNEEIIYQVNSYDNPIEYNNVRLTNPDSYTLPDGTKRYERGSLQNNLPPTIISYQVTEVIITIEAQDPINGDIYPRPDSFFIHRPYDGGVQLGTGGPQHGAQAIRQSKKYIRYQSGKGIMYTTGALFAPSYDLRSVTANGIEVNSLITVVTDDNDHGVQEGGVIRLLGIETPGFNSGPQTAVPPVFDYTVVSVIDERTFTVRSQRRLGSTTAKLGFDAQMSVVSWHGATVRSGIFDDQNGLFWEYDGTNINVVQRTGTKQISGTIAIDQNTNLMTGTNTKFRDQLKAGDRIILKGMTHVVTHVDSNTECTISPDWRGVVNISGAKANLIVEKRVKQSDFNHDKLDGTGPSGYDIDIAKMQMIGIQYSWYGAGFIDYMLRGTDGNFVFAHRMRNSNVNTEAFMRSGNLPVRYEVSNEGPSGKLKNSMDLAQTTCTLYDSSFFPNNGVIYIDNEVIQFTGNDIENNQLTGLIRGSSLTNFQAGAIRNYTAGPAASHQADTGIILISTTITPLISHWGSAFLTDGGFDEDRGYIFSYTVSQLSISTSAQTAFLIRLAPSVSNALVGDLGERELLNRAQLLLQGIEITSDTGSGGIVIDGILNPQNYPTNPSAITWSGLSNQAQGGQPSFAQVAAGGAIDWGAGTPVTATATVESSIDTGFVFNGIQRDRYSPLPLLLSEFNNNPILVGSIMYSTNPDVFTDSGETFFVTNIIQFPNFGEVDIYYNSTLGNQQSQGNTNTNTDFKFIYAAPSGKVSKLLFTKSSWEASGASIGTPISPTDSNWPAGTAVSNVQFLRHGQTEFYEVSFNNTSVNNISPGNTVTFEFGSASYAEPGETVFSFIANPGERSVLGLQELKELTNTPLGGRGIYPNGPDILAINVYKVTGSAVNSNITLRWGEAQA